MNKICITLIMIYSKISNSMSRIRKGSNMVKKRGKSEPQSKNDTIRVEVVN